MTLVSVNYLAVLVAAIVGFGIGAFWYSPAGFGKTWSMLMGFAGREAEMKKTAQKSMAIGFVTALITACVLAQFVSYTQAYTLMEGLLLGFWIWLGFIATTLLGGFLWEAKPFKLYAINVGYYLVMLVVMGIILALWH